MDDQKISVTLTGPAKIGGNIERPGRTVTVSVTHALQLVASGAISHEAAEALASTISGDTVSGFDQRMAEREKEIEQRLRDEIGDEYAALKAENAALTKLVRDLEDANAGANADIATLTASLTGEVNVRAETEKQLATAATRIAELEEIITARGVAAEEAAEDATNTQKAGKKPAAAKD